MHKVRIADICRVTGLSRSTVDRALNGRGQVHPRTEEAIQRTIHHLSERGMQVPSDAKRQVDVLLRLGKGMMHQMKRVFDQVKGPDDGYYDLYQMGEESVLRQLREICSDNERAAIVAVKDTDRIRSLLTRSRRAGKRIVALISELGADARDGFVGIDNKAAGATAAYLVSQAIGDRPATAGVIVGDTAFRCHEDREIGFRTTLREIGRRVVLAGEAKGEDNPERTYFAARKMLEVHPGIGAIYNVSGGKEGLARALAETGREQDIIVICHELTNVSVPLLANNSINFIFSQDPLALLSKAFELARIQQVQNDTRWHIDFGIYTRYNLPEYARDLEL